MIYLQLFYTFFKIGLFGFGGGYAMLSMIQAIWLSVTSAFAIASLMTDDWVYQISFGSCSTQPGFGKYCWNGF